MTLFLQYVNNHILDDAHYIWWPIVFLGDEICVCSGQGYAEF